MQTEIGAKKAMETIKMKHGVTKDGKSKLHVLAGRLGGLKRGDELKSPKGFGFNRERARQLGSKGGSVSKRGKTFIREENGKRIYLDHTTNKVEKYEIHTQ